MKKVALYCRVSSEDQKERDTIDNQVEILNTYIEIREGLEVFSQYLDNGVSGTIDFDKRPEGLRLINDAKKGLFDIVLVWKIDRFGRDTLSGLKAIEMLRKYDIEILSVTEPFDLNTPTGRFQFITYLNMAELERNNILDRMYLGATRAAKKGKWMGGIVPYGYNVNNNGFLEINEIEAQVVKDIYNYYINDRFSTINIAVLLNSLNIPCSCADGKGKRTKNITGKWRSASVQRIISSTTYKGIHFYGKKGTRRKELIERAVPAIIDTDFWERAQRVKEENVIISKRNTKVREYLLRGLITCKHCGKKFYGISYQEKSSVYCCSGKRGDNKRILGIKCDNMNINATMVEEQVLKDCLWILKNYEKHIESLRKTDDIEDNKTEEDLKALSASLELKKTEKNNIYSLFRKNKISEEDLDIQIEDIKKEEEKLISLINVLVSKKEMFKHEDQLVAGMFDKLKFYHDRINYLTFEDKCDLVKLLVKDIEVEAVIEDGIRAPKAHIIYNLVKLDDYTDKGSKLQLT